MKIFLLTFITISCLLFSCSSESDSDDECSSVISSITDSFTANKLAGAEYRADESNKAKCTTYQQTLNVAIQKLETAFGNNAGCFGTNERTVYEGNLTLLTSNLSDLDCN